MFPATQLHATNYTETLQKGHDSLTKNRVLDAINFNENYEVC
jgi:hypothetical protein